MTAPHDNTTAPVEWTSHPARERPRDTAMALVLVVTVSAAAGLFGGSSGWGVLAVMILMAALNRFFFPSRFRIDDEGIVASYPIRRKKLKWNRVRRFLHDENGGYLSTRSRRSWTDAYRGMHVQFGPEHERIIELIEAKVAAARRERQSVAGDARGRVHNDNEQAMRMAVEGGAS